MSCRAGFDLLLLDTVAGVAAVTASIDAPQGALSANAEQSTVRMPGEVLGSSLFRHDVLLDDRPSPVFGASPCYHN